MREERARFSMCACVIKERERERVCLLGAHSPTHNMAAALDLSGVSKVEQNGKEFAGFGKRNVKHGVALCVPTFKCVYSAGTHSESSERDCVRERARAQQQYRNI